MFADIHGVSGALADWSRCSPSITESNERQLVMLSMRSHSQDVEDVLLAAFALLSVLISKRGLERISVLSVCFVKFLFLVIVY